MVRSHQPYEAARAHQLSRSGYGAEASAAFHPGIGLTQDPAVRSFLLQLAQTE